MKWWEESWYAKQYPDIKLTPSHKIHCPVCHEYLGDRFEGTIFQGHCTECMATFTFSPGDEPILAELDSKKRHSCHCLNCSKEEFDQEKIQPYFISPPYPEDDFI